MAIEFANQSNRKATAYLYENKNYPLTIIDISKLYFSFDFCGIKGINIFRYPIYYKHSNGVVYEFVSGEQFNSFLNTFNYPFIQCNTCKWQDQKCTANFVNLNKHRNHNFLIIEGFKYKIKTKEEFNKFFINRPAFFINKEFESPISFEKNFNYYFNYRGKINDKFYVYDDNNDSRLTLTVDIKTMDKKILNYYGASGKGKSVTLIGLLKYREDFDEVGSLYINCKTIKSLLSENKILIAKQIFIDEINVNFGLVYPRNIDPHLINLAYNIT